VKDFVKYVGLILVNLSAPKIQTIVATKEYPNYLLTKRLSKVYNSEHLKFMIKG
jgi:hypothetical protein